MASRAMPGIICGVVRTEPKSVKCPLRTCSVLSVPLLVQLDVGLPARGRVKVVEAAGVGAELLDGAGPENEKKKWLK